MAVQPDLGVFGRVRTGADFAREAEEFALKRLEAKTLREKAVLDAEVARAKIANPNSNTDLPAAIQIANKMQELQKVANSPQATPEQRAEAASLYNHLGQAAKTYGFDRGVEYANGATPMAIPGYGQAVGGIAAEKAGMERAAQKGVDAQMNPIIAGGETAARLGQQLNYGGAIAAEETAARKEAERLAGLRSSLPSMRNRITDLSGQTENFKTVANEALKQSSDWTTGLPAVVTSRIPGMKAFDLAKNLDTIKASLGFEALQEMRDNSPTGGALGQVSDFENRQLQAKYRSLEQSQSREQFEKNLQAVIEQRDRSWQNIQRAYEQDYGGIEGFTGAADLAGTPARVKGKVYDGYLYLGGDPYSESSYRKVK